MKYRLDMVHHNPGEKPFETEFTKPEKLTAYGFNGQVFKHINCAVLLEGYDPKLWEGREKERAFVEELGEKIKAQNNKAKAQGLKVFYHVDLFVLPKALTEKHGKALCSSVSDRISVDAPDTLRVHRIMLNEIFTRFPEVDGLIIRVGETYLYDTPYHTGNGPILPEEYGQGAEAEEKGCYVRLLQFLREEICVRHQRDLIFRTWDCFPDRLHANPAYYLEVTNQIEPHERLLFSIKHTALDFWRRVKFNECLCNGRHRQIVEVQCQREYEGKGAYPSYVMDGVINGFEENRVRKGLKDIVKDSHIMGIYAWSRGGGWFGPYIQNELWCDLNAYVIAQYAENPRRQESEIFYSYTAQILGMSERDGALLRKICLLSGKAVLKGRYCRVFDEKDGEAVMPVCNWMRDDRLGGEKQLGSIRDYLREKNLVKEALAEKEEAVLLWEEISGLAAELHCPSLRTESYIRVSCEYGLRLFRVVESIWQVLLAEGDALEPAVAYYDRAFSEYRELEHEPQCASLYRDEYLYRLDENREAGAGDMVNARREELTESFVGRAERGR